MIFFIISTLAFVHAKCDGNKLDLFTHPWSPYQTEWLYVPTYSDGMPNRVFFNDGIRKDICTALRLSLFEESPILTTSIFNNRKYHRSNSSFIQMEFLDNICDNDHCKVRLCCPPQNNRGEITQVNDKFECKEQSENYTEPFYTKYFEGFDTQRNESNVLLKDSNFRFDLCQAFRAEKLSTNFDFVSFLFKWPTWEQAYPDNMEFQGDQVRYCCPGILNPKIQLDIMFSNYTDFFSNHADLINKKKLKNRVYTVLQRQVNRMKAHFSSIEEKCRFQMLKELT